MEFGEVARIVREGCNGIKQFEKQVSKVTVKKYAGKNRTGEREKTSRNVGWGGGGDERRESSISNEEVKVYKRNFRQDPMKIKRVNGRRGKVLWCDADGREEIFFQDTKVKKVSRSSREHSLLNCLKLLELDLIYIV